MKRPVGKKTKKRLPINTRPTTKKAKKKVAKKVVKRSSTKSKFVAKAKQVAETATHNPYPSQDAWTSPTSPLLEKDPIAPLQEVAEVEQVLEPHGETFDDTSATDDGSVSEGGN